ncbi:hypothetical protein ND748_20835 [Frankia sp. AiPs1]|uniref:hypothetical protein n=1 Tax=Frankia sp. AiPs1 TaxID=573493 RepID=UPI0020436148|nr:hypothetical protein [Frankia sp. AiPs1]MCM3924105.1 hypothetical protein [Frankia sp. AiPs1]
MALIALAGLVIGAAGLAAAGAALLRPAVRSDARSPDPEPTAGQDYRLCPYQVDANRGLGAATVDINPGGFIEQEFDAAPGFRITHVHVETGFNSIIADRHIAGPVQVEIRENGIAVSAATVKIDAVHAPPAELAKQVVVEPGRSYSLRVANSSGQILSPYPKPGPGRSVGIEGLTDKLPVTGRQLSGQICGP